jgi:hypothetical protein
MTALLDSHPLFATRTEITRTGSTDPTRKFRCQIWCPQADLEQYGPTAAAARENARAYAIRLALYQPTIVVYGNGEIVRTYLGDDRYGIQWSMKDRAPTYFAGGTYGFETESQAFKEIVRLAEFRDGIVTVVLGTLGARDAWKEAADAYA